MDVANDNEKLPRTRAEAKALGGIHYYTGKPCKHGHIDVRYTTDGACAECARIKGLRRYYENWEENKSKTREYMNRRYAEDEAFRNAAKAKQKAPEIREKKKEYYRAWRAALTDEDRLQIRTYMREYQRELHRTSDRARLNRSIYGGIYKSLSDGAKAGRKWELLVGYTIDDLMAHLEKKFTPGMSWDNYGDWHIDHEVPKSAFNYETPEHLDFKRCWALNNLRPMWAKANISKGNRLSAPFQPSLLIATNDNMINSPQKETTHGLIGQKI
ncbi:hypothetical protein QWJ46_00490 [Rhizobium sp. CBN3]|uniref:hypothetical protein n=1 Tax=Rhizobium sp. CBN3 TaxID=3058045 RepID=UPI0026721745|nr:hypothetical protein [Rhizobium sp. CBN3]MDO3431151.1 hypothetical protein [Rhizobium sp. CBN3]